MKYIGTSWNELSDKIKYCLESEAVVRRYFQTGLIALSLSEINSIVTLNTVLNAFLNQMLFRTSSLIVLSSVWSEYSDKINDCLE